MEDKEKDFLNAVYQNSKTGMLSIKDIIDEVKDQELSNELNREYGEYERLASKCETYASNENLDIKDNNFMEKAKLWTSIKMTTMMDKSTRHITEMLLLGTVMGLNQCYKDKFDFKNVNQDIAQLLQNLEEMEENNYEKLKGFLKKEI